MLLIESSRASGRALLQGISNYSHDHGPWSFYWEPGGLEKAWPKLKSLELHGLILRDVGRMDEAFAFGIPAVVVGHSRPEVAGMVNVVTDSLAIGRIAAEHLLACGFKKFAYCGLEETPCEHAWSQLRKEGFAQQLEQAGFNCDFYRVNTVSGRSIEQQRQAMARWLRSLSPPVGIMACNDDCGVQLIEACKLAGLPVPDAVGVIGADNDELLCGLPDPAMSSIAINFERAGYEAARSLDQLMRGERPVPSKILVSPTHLVARRSTDFVATEDFNLAKALRFIRDHIRQPLSVGEVAQAAGVSRRALERRFQHEIGHSILEEIRRLRTDQIAQLLIETELPIGHIAETLGFSDVQHFARYFRAGKLMSPAAYRRSFGARPALGSVARIGGSLSQSGVVSRRLAA